MTDAQIYKYATTMTEDLFMMSVTGIADEYDSDNWDAVNASMRDLYRVCNKSMKEIRRYTGLTQGSFAELINSNKRTVEDWEYGKRNPTDTVKFLILQYLGMFKRDTKNYKAIYKIYGTLDSTEDFTEWKERNEKAGYLTVNTGKDNNKYAWYYDGSTEIAVNVDTLYTISEEQIADVLE